MKQPLAARDDRLLSYVHLPANVLAFAAMKFVPDEATNGEAPFWVGVTLADTGNEADAIPYLKRASAQDERWAELIGRLSASGLLPDDEALIGRLKAGMTE